VDLRAEQETVLLIYLYLEALQMITILYGTEISNSVPRGQMMPGEWPG
jgi:hypothetical protein